MLLIKFPPEIKDALVAWYSPYKQKLSNYDVIESYTEDFTLWNYFQNNGTAEIKNNKLVITNILREYSGVVGKDYFEDINLKLSLLIKGFQIAAQANPKLTYVEFCKTINNE